MKAVRDALASALHRPDVVLRSATSLGAGIGGSAQRLETSEGVFFVKSAASGPTEIFAAEAAGLDALRGADSELVIPRVIAVSPGSAASPAFLVTEFLEEGNGQRDEEKLGRGLARIHAQRAKQFGFERITCCGTTPQENGWLSSWPEFFARRRLTPLLDILRSRGLPASASRVYDNLTGRLPALLSHEPAPSLIHGDLWAGNLLWSSGGPALIDPACAFADREMEFSIGALFGGLSDRAFAAYREAAPLEPGFRERLSVYGLYHLLNHAVLFGDGYEAQARELARRY